MRNGSTQAITERFTSIPQSLSGLSRIFISDGNSGDRYIQVSQERGWVTPDRAPASGTSVEHLELVALRARVTALEAEVTNLRAPINNPPEPRVVSPSRARKEVKQYFEEHHGAVLYAPDVALALNLDLGLIEEAIEQLLEDGQVTKAG